MHGMVCEALQRWGTAKQRLNWLPQLATGEAIAAFALTEVEAGSDAKGIATVAMQRNGSYALSGEKRWITAAQIADLFEYSRSTTARIRRFWLSATLQDFG